LAGEPSATLRGSRLSLRSGTAAHVTVADAYTGRSRTYSLRPGHTLVHELDLHHSWYDVTVRGGGFLGRFAGHLETGRPSVSDPALITR
jgi:phospholipase C